MSGGEDGFRSFLRHEKEGDGADDDNGDSDEDEHNDDGRRASEGSSCAPRTNFQGSGSSRDRDCRPASSCFEASAAPLGYEFCNHVLNLSLQVPFFAGASKRKIALLDEPCLNAKLLRRYFYHTRWCFRSKFIQVFSDKPKHVLQGVASQIIS